MRVNNRAFSLVELMVSLTIFSLVMITSIGALLTMIDANAKAQALYTSMTNLSFTIDNMTRNLRTGYDYYCPNANANESLSSNMNTGNSKNCTNGSAIAFTREKDRVRVGYKYDSADKMLQQRIIYGEVDTGWVDIDAGGIEIDTFEVTVDGAISGDTVQPQIILFIKGSVKNGLDTPTQFQIQTNVTQRVLNY